MLDQQTHQPIAGVRVQRVRSEDSGRNLDAPKGAQLLDQAPAVRTGADGTFVLDSVRDLALFQKLRWYSVSLSFTHAHYERFVASYTLANAAQTAAGEPVVNAGDILLRPSAN